MQRKRCPPTGRPSGRRRPSRPPGPQAAIPLRHRLSRRRLRAPAGAGARDAGETGRRPPPPSISIAVWNARHRRPPGNFARPGSPGGRNPRRPRPGDRPVRNNRSRTPAHGTACVRHPRRTVLLGRGAPSTGGCGSRWRDFLQQISVPSDIIPALPQTGWRNNLKPPPSRLETTLFSLPGLPHSRAGMGVCCWCMNSRTAFSRPVSDVHCIRQRQERSRQETAQCRSRCERISTHRLCWHRR